MLAVASVATTAAQSTPPRVPTEVAMKQLIKRVEPVVSQEAIKLKVGGPVIADVIVSPKGTVESVTIIAGPPMLHGAATDAFKQWVFKPFLRNGKPAPALVMVEVAFPDPIREEQERASQRYSGARNTCQRDLESAPATAVSSCSALVELAKRLVPPDPDEVRRAYGFHAESLYRAGRVRESVAEFERALAMPQPRRLPGDSETASLYAIVGMLNEQLGELQPADTALSKATAEYEAAIIAIPDLAPEYRKSLKLVLEHHASVKRLLRQESAAAAIDAKALTLVTPPVAPAPAPSNSNPSKTIGSVICFGAYAVQLTDDDIQQIRAKLPSGSLPWFIVGENARGQSVEIYLEPTMDSPTIRRGAMVVAVFPPESPRPAVNKRSWQVISAANSEYAQIPPSGSDPQLAWGRIENRPFHVGNPVSGNKFSDAELIEAVTVVRTAAARTPAPAPGAQPRFFTDVQPWPIRTVMPASGSDIRVVLNAPGATDGFQSILLRRTAGKLTIVELSGG